MKPDPKPLYRKVNTRTHGVRHGKGGEARWDRNSKAGQRDGRMMGAMHGQHRHGRDYTPLYRFLISKVGEPFDKVHAAAAPRLDDPEQIFTLVARGDCEKFRWVGVGESTYFSGLCVDDNGLLAKVDPDLDHTNIDPSCACCTHTFNGIRFSRPFVPPAD